jgi:magnesium transporter
MSDVCGRLANLDVPSIGAESRPYFRVMHEHLTRLDAMVSGLIEIIRSVFETSSLLEVQRQGIITRQLAAWAAILGVPAAIAGIYATTAPNVPELRGPFGYSIVIGIMLAICLGLYIRFKRLNWL